MAAGAGVSGVERAVGGRGRLGDNVWVRRAAGAGRSGRMRIGSGKGTDGRAGEDGGERRAGETRRVSVCGAAAG